MNSTINCLNAPFAGLSAGPVVLAPNNGPATTIVPPASAPGTTSAPTSNCDPNYDRLRGQLLAAITTEIFQAQQMIAAGTASQNAAFFDQLAKNTRDLGNLEGKQDACKPSPYTVAQAAKLYTQNTQTLVMLEARLVQTWLAKDFTMWMALRAQLETYHRVVTALGIWRAQQPAPTPFRPVPIAPRPPSPAPAPNTGVLVPTPAPMPITPKPPIYKRPWIWLAVAAGGGLVWILSRRSPA